MTSNTVLKPHFSNIHIIHIVYISIYIHIYVYVVWMCMYVCVYDVLYPNTISREADQSEFKFFLRIVWGGNFSVGTGNSSTFKQFPTV